MFRLLFPLATLSMLVACNNKSAQDSGSWWNVGGDTSGNTGSVDNDDDEDDDEGGDYAEFFLEGTRDDSGNFSGMYGYEASTAGVECFMEFIADGVSAASCDGCDGAMTVTIDNGEIEGDCTLPETLPASADGDVFTFGWSGEILHVQDGSTWSVVSGGEVLEEDGMWGFWVELIGFEDDEDEDDEDDEDEDDGEE